MFNVPKDEQDSAKARLLAKAKAAREKKKLKEESEAKSCPDGKYWCFDDEKCKKIPKGYSVGRGGYLSREDDDDIEVNDMGDGDGGGGGLGESNLQEIAPIALGALALKGIGAGLAGYSAYSAGKNLQKGNYGAAALDALGAVPGVGIFGKGAKVAKGARAARAARNAGRVNSASKAVKTGKNANKAKRITGVKRNVLGNVASNVIDNIRNNSSSSSSSKKYGATAKDMDAPDSKDALEKYRKMIAKKKQETNVDENYNHSNWRDDFSALEVESFDIIKAEPLTPSKGIGSDMLDEKCWPGYTKKGMKTMFGKKYPNCVKKKSK